MERIALVGLSAESLDLIPLVRRSGRGEVCLLADADPSAPTHALAAVFQVPSTPRLESVEDARVNLVVLPDLKFGSDTWQPRWSGKGLRWMSEEEAWKYFAEVAPPPPPPQPAQDAPEGRTRTMTPTATERTASEAVESAPLFPSSLRAAAMHLEQFMEETCARLDAAAGYAFVWDAQLNELLPAFEVTGREAGAVRPGEFAERWLRRAWSERRALTLQEVPLVTGGEFPQRARTMVALPMGEEGLVFIEDAWLTADPRSRDRDDLEASARAWSAGLSESRAEQDRVAHQRMQDGMGRAVYELLPEGDAGNPWPAAARTLAELLDADAVVFHLPGLPPVATEGVDAAWAGYLEAFLGGKSEESLQAHPILAARSRSQDGQELRELGVASCVMAGRGAGDRRVAVAAVRRLESGKDEFRGEHASALRKFLVLTEALSRGN
jgi:hypothetical protein